MSAFYISFFNLTRPVITLILILKHVQCVMYEFAEYESLLVYEVLWEDCASSPSGSEKVSIYT